MKKFTGNFLLGELGIWCHLRKIGLGLVLALWTTLAFAQGNQVTYQLKAATYTDCYRIDNSYLVPVYMKDFLKIKEFSLEFTYPNVDDFDFVDVVDEVEGLGAVTFTHDPATGKVVLKWGNKETQTPVTLTPTGEEILVFKLKFNIPAFQHQYSVANKFEFASLIDWNSAKVELWNDKGQCDILNSNITDGSLTITQKWPSVVIDSGVANCDGDNVTVEVTTPTYVDGMLYSFNGNTYQPLNKSEVYAPSEDNQLIIKDASCISYIKKFDVEAVTPLTFTVASPVYTLCPGGNGDIEIVAKNGTKPYIYYVVPESQWEHGDQVYQHLQNGNKTILNKYTFSNYVVQRPPGKYWVAVQDANDCVPISGSYMMAYWKTVQVIDDNEPWDITTLEGTQLVTSCFGQEDGRIVFSIGGANPWEDGYTVALNGMYVGRMFEYDSDVETLCQGVPCMKSVLAPGTYTFVISDANGCSTTKEYTITQPKQIKFTVDHTDAGCDQAVGKLWIASVDASTGSGDISTWEWSYSTDPSWTDPEAISEWFPLDYHAENLPAGVYYVKVKDGNGCEQEWINEVNHDAAIKILTTVFDLVYDPIKCFGDATTARIVLVSGDANHTFNYKAEKWVGFRWVTVSTGPDGWQTSNSFSNLTAGLYRFSVKDLTAANCVVTWRQFIENPFPLNIDVLTYNTRPPSCPGNNDGNISVRAYGGRPWGTSTYQFAIDDRPFNFASEISNFAAGAGEHTIYVKDSAGCVSYVKVRLPGGENMIDFQDKIYVQCTNDSVNLFNAQAFDWWWMQVGLDKGYLLDYDWYLWENHVGDEDQYDWIWVWTSGGDWVRMPYQGNIYSRNPKLYITQQPWTVKSDIVATGEVVGHNSTFKAGTYFLVAKDEWGCYSNVDTIQIIEPEPLEVIVSKEDAGCFGTWTGKIKAEAFNGQWRIPSPAIFDPRYQYVLVNQPDIFSHPTWATTQVTWTDFKNENDFLNDSVLLISVQKGTYWLAVRDFCGIHDPSLVFVTSEPIVIDGKDPIVATPVVTNVSCFEGKDGAIFATEVAGGFGGYSYELELVEVAKPNPATGWPLKNKTGSFLNLAAGTYKLIVKDSKGCAPFEKVLTVTQPDKLVLTLEKANPSCFGAEDGIIRYIITGGTQPYKESTNNGQNWFTIPENKLSTTVFDRRAAAGTYKVMIEDAHGCKTEATVTLAEPAELGLVLKLEKKVSCAQEISCNTTNPIADGVIKATVSGGWNAANDGFNYYVIGTKGKQRIVKTLDKTGTAEFTGLNIGEWSFKLYEWNSSFAWGKPYIMNPDYATAYAGGFPSEYQNPDTTNCVKTGKLTMVSYDPINYSVQYVDVKCRNGKDGEIRITNVTGGAGPYRFMIQGPADNSALNGVWKDPAKKTDNFYTFKGLPWGHYNVFVKDTKDTPALTDDCVVCLEAGTIHNPDSLELVVKLVDNAKCYNEASGKITLLAKGGVGGYKYAVALASEVEQYLFPLDDAAFVNKLPWQDSPDFNVKAGVWIGYVKDANRCIQGHSTNAQGVRIMNHRVVVLEPLEVVGTATSGTTMATGLVDCFGNATGWIQVTSLTGGSGAGWSALVTGKDYTGAEVSKHYANVSLKGDAAKLTGLKASTNEKDPTKVPAAEKYSVVFYDSHGCASAPVLVAVMQPEAFEIEIYVTQDAFICANDKAGIFEIRVLSGGTVPVIYRYEAWEGTVKKIDSPWGAVNAFQGEAGLLYKAWAKDANGCVAYAEKFVEEPEEVKIVSIEDLTCYGADKASAKIKVTGEPGRTFTVSYKKFPYPEKWTEVTGSFTSEKVITGLTYGDTSDQYGHYKFKVTDNMGCSVESAQVTFVPVQQPLTITLCCVEEAECTGSIRPTVTGGTAPYVVTLNDEPATLPVEGGSFVLPGGEYTMKVVDAHGCVATATFVITTKPVVRELTVHAYKGETGLAKDTEAGLDSLLAVGVHTFKYTFNECERTLIVTVVDDLVRTATITSLQNDATLLGKYREITGTVTAVVPGAGYFVQDANAPWSGIYVADATLTVVEGVGVKVEGTTSEVDKVTTLTAAKSQMVSAPLTITPLEMADPAAAKNEMYESVLVIVKGARFMGTPAADGSWEIKTTDALKLTVNDWLFSYVPVDGHFYNVTGVVNGKADLYKLEPRKAADVVDLSTSTPVIDVNNLQFKVYPNPFSDVLNIDNSEKLTRVTVTNIAGQRVIDVQHPERVIRTSNLVSGVYVVTLFTEEGIAKSERLVKR